MSRIGTFNKTKLNTHQPENPRGKGSAVFKKGRSILMGLTTMLPMAGCYTSLSGPQVIGIEPVKRCHDRNYFEGKNFSFHTTKDANGGELFPTPEERWPLFPENIRFLEFLPSFFQHDAIDLLENKRHFVIASDPYYNPFGNISFVHTKPNPKYYKEPLGTLVFFPGVPGLKYDFHKPAIQLAGLGYEVYAVDEPGKGYSTSDERHFEFALDDYARFQRWFVQGMGLKNWYMVLNSYAGTTGVHTLLRYGKEDLNLEGLIFTNCVSWAVHPETLEIPSSEKLTGTPILGPLGVRHFSGLPYLGIADSYQAYLLNTPEDETKSIIEQYTRHWNRNATLWMIDSGIVDDAYDQTSAQNRSMDYANAYANRMAPNFYRLKDVPILYIAGGADEVVTYGYSSRLFSTLNSLSGYLRNEFFHIPLMVGHMEIFLNWSSVKMLSEKIHAFVQGNREEKKKQYLVKN